MSPIIRFCDPLSPNLTYLECIALRSRRSLLTLGPADVGSSSSNIRVNLRRWLSIGKRLKAVVLIANCDMIIQRQTTPDNRVVTGKFKSKYLMGSHVLAKINNSLYSSAEAL